MPVENRVIQTLLNSLTLTLYVKVKEDHQTKKVEEDHQIRRSLFQDLMSELRDYRGKEFQDCWNDMVDEFIDNDPPEDAIISQLESQLKQILAGTTQDSNERPEIIKFGSFRAFIRPLGYQSGAEFGRAPGLEWEAPQSTEIPDQLKNELKSLLGLNPTFERARLPFCQDAELWHLWFPEGLDNGKRRPAADAFVITAAGIDRPIFLDWTNEPIYQLNSLKLFQFGADLRPYVRCFFHLVRGKLGSFTILEQESDVEGLIPWNQKKEAQKDVADQKKKIKAMLTPLEETGITPQGETILRATVLFKNALFYSDVLVSPIGLLRLDNEELKFEHLNVVTDGDMGAGGNGE